MYSYVLEEPFTCINSIHPKIIYMPILSNVHTYINTNIHTFMYMDTYISSYTYS